MSERYAASLTDAVQISSDYDMDLHTRVLACTTETTVGEIVEWAQQYCSRAQIRLSVLEELPHDR